MSTPAAISGDYADFKLIKSRSVAQVVVEIPIEEGERFIRAFGVPQPGHSTRVALARLAEPKTIEYDKPEKEKRAWRDLPPSQQAAMRCNEPAFRQFVIENPAGLIRLDNDTLADVVRRHCGVESRRYLDSNPEAEKRWRQLDDKYIAWKAA